MKKQTLRTFRERLHADLADPEFRRYYKQEKGALELAAKIMRLRKRLGLNQKELAKRMQTSQQTVSRIESGEYEGFTYKTLKKIAEATGSQLKIDFLPAR